MACVGAFVGAQAADDVLGGALGADELAADALAAGVRIKAETDLSKSDARLPVGPVNVDVLIEVVRGASYSALKSPEYRPLGNLLVPHSDQYQLIGQEFSFLAN